MMSANGAWGLARFIAQRVKQGQGVGMSIKTLFVGNIPYSATEADLMDHFADYGGNNVRIIEGRGFAFVDVAADRCGAAIEEKHNSEMSGRKLNVDEARPRQGNGGGGGGGRYGGGGRDYGGGDRYGGDRRRY